jgi:hypothetical protein
MSHGTDGGMTLKRVCGRSTRSVQRSCAKGCVDLLPKRTFVLASSTARPPFSPSPRSPADSARTPTSRKHSRTRDPRDSSDRASRRSARERTRREPQSTLPRTVETAPTIGSTLHLPINDGTSCAFIELRKFFGAVLTGFGRGPVSRGYVYAEGSGRRAGLSLRP